MDVILNKKIQSTERVNGEKNERTREFMISSFLEKHIENVSQINAQLNIEIEYN